MQPLTPYQFPHVEPKEVNELEEVKYLYLRVKNITSIGSDIRWYRGLRKLDLSGNFLRSLPPELFSLSKLNELYLSGNQIKVLPPEIGCLTQLVGLFLSQNQIKELPNELGQLNNLKELDIRANPILQLPPVVELLNCEICV